MLTPDIGERRMTDGRTDGQPGDCLAMIHESRQPMTSSSNDPGQVVNVACMSYCRWKAGGGRTRGIRNAQVYGILVRGSVWVVVLDILPLIHFSSYIFPKYIDVCLALARRTVSPYTTIALNHLARYAALPCACARQVRDEVCDRSEPTSDAQEKRESGDHAAHNHAYAGN